MHNTLAARSHVQLHDHPEEQFTLIVSGRLRFAVVIDDETVESEVGPGEVVHLPGGRPHAATALEDSVFFDVFVPVRHELLAG
jgi:quercetin dioxygenase-like cupin family protein